MKRFIALGLLVALVLGIALALLVRRLPRPARTASVLYVGMTNISAGGRVGNGTPEFPLLDLAALHVTNLPSSGRVGLFMLTNGTRNDAYFGFDGKIQVQKDGKWVERASDRTGFGWELEPGKSCVQAIPEPATNLPWRIRLGIHERPRGPKGMLDRITAKNYNTILYPRRPYEIVSPAILNGRVEPADLQTENAR
jgi:hypothetical protein